MFAVLGLIPIRLADSQCWQSESCIALCTAAAPAAVTRGVELSDSGFMYTLLARLVKFFLILVFVYSGNELLLIDHCFWCCVCVWALLIVAKLLVYADIIVEVVSLFFCGDTLCCYFLCSKLSSLYMAFRSHDFHLTSDRCVVLIANAFEALASFLTSE